MTNDQHRSKIPTILAIASIASPFLSTGLVVLVQGITHSSFWESVHKEETQAAALMGWAEIIQIGFGLAIGCLLGIILGIISIKLRKRIICFGLAAIAFNSIPFLFLFALWGIQLYKTHNDHPRPNPSFNSDATSASHFPHQAY